MYVRRIVRELRPEALMTFSSGQFLARIPLGVTYENRYVFAIKKRVSLYSYLH